jgi:hypothetical protein
MLFLKLQRRNLHDPTAKFIAAGSERGERIEPDCPPLAQTRHVLNTAKIWRPRTTLLGTQVCRWKRFSFLESSISMTHKYWANKNHQYIEIETAPNATPLALDCIISGFEIRPYTNKGDKKMAIFNCSKLHVRLRSRKI